MHLATFILFKYDFIDIFVFIEVEHLSDNVQLNWCEKLIIFYPN